ITRNRLQILDKQAANARTVGGERSSDLERRVLASCCLYCRHPSPQWREPSMAIVPDSSRVHLVKQNPDPLDLRFRISQIIPRENAGTNEPSRCGPPDRTPLLSFVAS